MKKTAVYKWMKRFSEGRKSVTDEERSGRPTTSRTEENITNICQIVVCFLLGDSPASEIYMLTFRNTLSVPSS